MKISTEGIKFISNWEGKRNSVYKDVAGYPTIGIGHLIVAGERFPDKLSDEEVFELFRKDVVRFEDAVNEAVQVKINQNQFDAMVSLAFNIGVHGFKKSSVVRHLNQGNINNSASSFLLWNKAGGKVIQGLKNRRKAERELFLKDFNGIEIPDKKNWYDEVLEWSNDNGIMSKERPNDKATRAEIAAMLKAFHNKFIK